MYSDIEEIAEEVAHSKVGLEPSDVTDLFRCIVKYMKEVSRSNSHYAIHLPTVGFMYRKLTDDMLQSKSPSTISLVEDMVTDTYYTKRRKNSLLTSKSWYEKNIKED